MVRYDRTLKDVLYMDGTLGATSRRKFILHPANLAKHSFATTFQTFGLPCGSAGKESACNVGDLDSTPGLEKGKATHSSILPWRIPWTVYIAHGVTKSQT